MLTAIAVLLLSAVGGGIIGSVLTESYPKSSCADCGYTVVKEAQSEQRLMTSENIDQDAIQSDETSSDDSKELSEIANNEVVE